MAYNVSSLNNYVDEKRLPLYVQSLLTSKVRNMFNVMNIKGNSAINLISTDANFQNADCTFNADGDTTLTQREIEPKWLKINLSWCNKTLQSTWANYELMHNADEDKLTFEEYIVNELMAKIGDGIEYLTFNGDSDNDGEFDGLIKILTNAVDTNKFASSATSIYDAVMEAYLSTPADVAMQDDFKLFVSYTRYRELVQEMIAKNLYNYNTNLNDGGKLMLQGTNCEVIPTKGMPEGKILGARLSNLFYGTDLEAASEDTFDLYFEKSDRTMRFIWEALIGVQVAYPSETTLSTINF